jgi:phage-related protein
MQVGELYARMALDDREFRRSLAAAQAALQGTEKVIQNMNTRLANSEVAFKRFAEAANPVQVTHAFSQLESSIRQTRAELSRLGFGQTKAEAKALEAQLYNLANVRMTRLKEEIALTEKALKQMKESGRADELVDEIKKAEAALARYKQQLADAEPIKKFAEAFGYEVQKIFGKDVFVKPITDQVARAKAQIAGFINQDLAAVANKTYEIIDGAAKKIVGAADTTAAQKAKIAQLPMIYQQIGMYAGMAAVAMAGVNVAVAKFSSEAENAWNRFQAQTLESNATMGEFKDLMVDTATTTGKKYGEVGEVFSHLVNQYNEGKETLRQSAEMAFAFADAWGVKPTQAIDSVRLVMKKLGVEQQQAADIMTLALKKYQGDIEKATEDVITHRSEWKNLTAAGTEGARAFEQMNAALDKGAMGRFGEALRGAKAVLVELYQAVEPTLTKIADGFKNATQAATEFLRNNPGIASFIGYLGMATTATVGFVAAASPVAGLLIQHRALFHGLAQSIVAMSTGGIAVLSPQVVALRTQLELFRNAIFGLPSVIAGLGPAMLTFARSLPGMVVNFVRLNPMLTAFGIAALVIKQNWETVGPVLTKIWADLKMALEPVFAAVAQANSTVWPVFLNVLNQISQVIAQVLVGALRAVEPVIRAVAQVINGDFGAAKATMTEFASSLLSVQNGLTAIGTVIGVTAAAWAAYSATVKAVTIAKETYTAVARAAAAAQTLFNAALRANPIGLVITAITALIAAGVALYTHWDVVKAKTQELWAALTTVWEGIKASIATAVESVRVAVTNAWTAIQAATSEIWNAIKQFLVDWWPLLLAAITGPVGLVVALVIENWDEIKAKTEAIWDAIKDFLTDLWSKIEDETKKIWNDIKKFFNDTLTSIKTAFTNVWTSIRDWLATTWSSIETKTQETWNSIKTFLSGLFQSIANEVNTKFKQIKDTISNVWSNIQTRTQEVWNNIKSWLISTFSQLAQNAISWGKNLVEGFWSGIQNMAGWLRSQVTGWIEGIKSHIKALFRISSPSGVMREIGQNVAEGLAVGIKDGEVNVKNAMSGISQSMISSLSTLPNEFGRIGQDAISSLVDAINSGKSAVQDAIDSITRPIYTPPIYNPPTQALTEPEQLWVNAGGSLEGFWDTYYEYLQKAQEEGWEWFYIYPYADPSLKLYFRTDTGEFIGTTEPGSNDFGSDTGNSGSNSGTTYLDPRNGYQGPGWYGPFSNAPAYRYYGSEDEYEHGNYNYPPAYMASGGIVRKAITAVIGEAGPEAVLPLVQLQPMMTNALLEAVKGLTVLASPQPLRSELHIHIENHGTIVGSRGMEEFADIVSRRIASKYGLATGGVW